MFEAIGQITVRQSGEAHTLVSDIYVYVGNKNVKKCCEKTNQRSLTGLKKIAAELQYINH